MQKTHQIEGFFFRDGGRSSVIPFGPVDRVEKDWSGAAVSQHLTEDLIGEIIDPA